MDDPAAIVFQPLPALGRPPAEPRSRRGLAVSFVLVALWGTAAGIATHAAFSDTTVDGGNTFDVGTVDIDDDDNGQALLAMTAGSPGASDIGCITVTFRGTLPSNVRLYGTTAGTGFDQYVDLTVERGTWSGAPPAFGACTGFTPDATNYIGAGAGVVYSGTLTDFPDSFAAGIVDGGGTPEAWTTDESRPYRFTATVTDTNGAQGLNASQTFTWEARNT